MSKCERSKNKTAFSFLRRLTKHHCSRLLPINICCPPALSSKPATAACGGRMMERTDGRTDKETDRQTDARQLHRPRYAYLTSTVSNQPTASLAAVQLLSNKFGWPNKTASSNFTAGQQHCTAYWEKFHLIELNILVQNSSTTNSVICTTAFLARH